MSHCISVILVKKEFLKENVEGSNVTMVELPKDIVAIPDGYAIARKVLKSRAEFLIVNTDYFGGCGDQSAYLLQNGDREAHTLTEYNRDRYGEINKALKEYGVVRDANKDEFDTMNLGSYRSNHDFYSTDPEPQLDVELTLEEKTNELIQHILSDKDENILKKVFNKLGETETTKMHEELFGW